MNVGKPFEAGGNKTSLGDRLFAFTTLEQVKPWRQDTPKGGFNKIAVENSITKSKSPGMSSLDAGSERLLELMEAESLATLEDILAKKISHLYINILQLLVYQVVNEGLVHEPKFRSNGLVDGVTYNFENTFPTVITTEHDVVKHALECILKKIKDEADDRYGIVVSEIIRSKAKLQTTTITNCVLTSASVIVEKGESSSRKRQKK
ncbi:hypothetical protein V6N12_017738 [Hibiscus sabdariffa]|uniref:Uncharacterized protein n=1 Tax=Hibiscus sabdariffa TaxID=183260 RepID=A0ABR2A0G9_9ROSI